MKTTFETQSAEFDMAHNFAERLNRLECTPIVDDDYPEARHRYEGALRDFIAALRANGRLEG